MSNIIKELTEKRGAKIEEARAIVEAAQAEDRELNSDELGKVEGIHEEAEMITRNLQVQAKQIAEEGRKLDDLSAGEKRDIATFSLSKFVRQASHGQLDGLEREMSQEGERDALASGISPRGLMIPFKAFESRDMTATGGSGLDQGGMTIATEKAGLLEALFNRNVAAQAGATVLTGLTSNFDVPRLVKGTLPLKKTENQQAVEYTATTAQVSFSPNRVPTVMEVSNQLLKQTNESALQSIFERHLQSELMDVMQRAFFHGGGTTEAVGIASTSGIGSVVGGAVGAAPDLADMIDLQTEVNIDNASVGNERYIINSKTEGKLRKTVVVSSTDSYRLIDGRSPGSIEGKPYLTTNAVSSALTKSSATGLSAIFYGNWADLWIANWGGIEILVNPFSKDDYGLTRINAAVYYDANVVRPESFSAMLDAITT